MDAPRPDKPHPLKGKNPWEGLTTRERNRRIKKMIESQRAAHAARAAAKAVQANAERIMSTPGRRTFDRAEKAAYVVKVDELIATGMMVKDACAQVGVGRTQYHKWRERAPRKANGKHLPVISRPPAHEIEVLDVPAPLARAAAHMNGGSRLDRLAALIVAVEKLL